MERISSRKSIKVPDRQPKGPLITTEAPFWREMLGEYVRDAVEARTWNPSVRSTSIENTGVLQREEVVSEDVDTSGILSRAKDIFSAPKRRTKRALLAGAVAGAALLSGFSAQESRATEEPETISIVAQTAPTTSLAERRTPADLFDLTKDRWMKVPISAEEAPPPPAMKAELKPKPKPKPKTKERSHYNHHDVSDVGSSAHCAPNLSEVKQIVCFEAEKRGVANQWYAIDFIVNHESTWDPAAQNPSSTACGLFQFLDRRACDPSMPGGVQAQAEAGLDYMIDRYGSPAGAYNFWQGNAWY